MDVAAEKWAAGAALLLAVLAAVMCCHCCEQQVKYEGEEEVIGAEAMQTQGC